MARSKTTAGKRQREQQKLTRARLKLERRESRHEDRGEPTPTLPGATEAELIEALAALHRSLESGEVSLPQFEERRELIRAQLEQLS